jgi:hypothetical protein
MVTSFTTNVADVEYDLDGETLVEVVRSPKFHKLVKVPEGMVEVFVKTKLFPVLHCELSLIVNPVKGFGLRITFLEVLSLHPKLDVANSLTVKVPVVVYDFEGEAKVEEVLSPKLQRLLKVPELMVVVLLSKKLLPLRH